MNTDPEEDPLYWATWKGDEPTVRRLIGDGATVQWNAEDQDSALHVAVERGEQRIVELLLAAGGEAILKKFDYISRTPLIVAAQRGQPEIATILLASGADIDAHDEETVGDTALIAAVKEGQLEMVELLLAAGANPNIRGWMQCSAVDQALVELKRCSDPRRERIIKLVDRAAERFPYIAVDRGPL